MARMLQGDGSENARNIMSRLRNRQTSHTNTEKESPMPHTLRLAAVFTMLLAGMLGCSVRPQPGVVTIVQVRDSAAGARRGREVPAADRRPGSGDVRRHQEMARPPADRGPAHEPRILGTSGSTAEDPQPKGTAGQHVHPSGANIAASDAERGASVPARKGLDSRTGTSIPEDSAGRTGTLPLVALTLTVVSAAVFLIARHLL
jgi:hypothetical protein